LHHAQIGQRFALHIGKALLGGMQLLDGIAPTSNMQARAMAKSATIFGNRHGEPRKRKMCHCRFENAQPDTQY
jgi:hypothetical protein